MAVAARPGPSDARVPCPLCGGLIHPIAGKCKHCKAELTTYHAARPAANTPLPALRPASPGSSHANGHANGHAGARPAYAPAAHAVPVPVAAAAAYDASQPVLPPRPAGHSYPTEPRTSGWRSWPVLVIILATVAIVVAVVLMVWPPGHEVDGKHTLAPPPAPDRMQTAPEITQQPLNPQVLPPAKADATRDPWAAPTPDPPAPSPSAGAIDPDPDPDSDVGGLIDPFATPHQRSVPQNRRRLNTNRRGMVMLAMAEHMCRKMVQCNAGVPTVKSMCDGFARRPSSPPTRCAAADRCFQHIDAMSCGPQSDNVFQLNALLTQFQDCADAVRC
jgi:hypothetical protein